MIFQTINNLLVESFLILTLILYHHFSLVKEFSRFVFPENYFGLNLKPFEPQRIGHDGDRAHGHGEGGQAGLRSSPRWGRRTTGGHGDGDDVVAGSPEEVLAEMRIICRKLMPRDQFQVVPDEGQVPASRPRGAGAQGDADVSLGQGRAC